MTWTRIIAKTAEDLACIHEKGFLHNDLKSNNVVLDNRDGVCSPVVIDFGNSVPMSSARGPKSLSAVRQRQYSREFPRIAPEIVGRVKGQSTAKNCKNWRHNWGYWGYAVAYPRVVSWDLFYSSFVNTSPLGDVIRYHHVKFL